MLQRGHSGDGCDLVSTLCSYDLRKGDLFVMSWAMVKLCTLGVFALGVSLVSGIVIISVCVS